jgi:hypothetical protein
VALASRTFGPGLPGATGVMLMAVLVEGAALAHEVLVMAAPTTG